MDDFEKQFEALVKLSEEQPDLDINDPLVFETLRNATAND